jgi:type II secretory pathway pseudopilin PulG
MKQFNRQPSGQALLIIILVLGVVLTVVLSVVSQSISDVKLSQKEEEANRAFNAAEAGIEQALLDPNINIDNRNVPLGTNGAVYSVKKTPMPAASQFVFPQKYRSGETATLSLSTHDATGSLVFPCVAPGCTSFTDQRIDICWGDGAPDTTNSSTPAVELSLLYFNAGEFKLKRTAIDPYNGADSARNSNGFNHSGAVAAVDSCNFLGSSFPFRYTLDLAALGVPSYSTSGTQAALRIKMHYNASAYSVGVKTVAPSTSQFPSQGVITESTGGVGESLQKLQVVSLFENAPSILDYALYAETGGLVKN